MGISAVLLWSSLVGSATKRPGIVSYKSAVHPEVVKLQVRNPRSIKVLQMTDLHFFLGEQPFWTNANKKISEEMHKLVQMTKPDMVIITGDLWRDSPPEKLEEFMRFAVSQCEALGVPWAFTWGNHDRVNDRQAAHELLTKARNSLYRGATSDGNYIVDMVDRRGRALWQILCLNSGDAGIGAEQKEWLKRINQISPKKGKVPPRLAAFHIPLKQYDDIWETGFARGIKYEKVCSEKENGSSLAILKNAGVHACFCGHDHVNDYSGVIDGVELIYGRTTGVGGYDAMQVPNGGKLYILNGRTGKYSWKSVLLNGKQ